MLALALPATAGAVPFGPPLGTSPFNTLPSYPYDCSAVTAPVIGVVPLYTATGALASSCIWIHVPTPAEAALFPRRSISLTPPGSGTVTKVSVAVGPRTGPMQVVVMRSLYENTLTPGRPNDACCFPVARSQTFTPRANGITTVPVHLRVREDVTPPPEDITTIADFDTLGLAVLAPGVPVPLYYTGDTSQPADFVWNTSTPSTVTPGFSTDSGGFFVALDGELLPTDPVGFGGGGTEPVRGSVADIALRCLASAACRGRITLQNRRGASPDLAVGHAWPPPRGDRRGRDNLRVELVPDRSPGPRDRQGAAERRGAAAVRPPPHGGGLGQRHGERARVVLDGDQAAAVVVAGGACGPAGLRHP